MPDPTILEAAVTVLLDAVEAATPVYGQLMPLGIAAPYIVFHRVSTDRSDYFHLRGAGRKALARIQVDCFATGSHAAKVLAGKVRQALNGYRGTVVGVEIGSCRLDSERGDEEISSDPKLFQVSQDYVFLYTEI